MLLLDRTTVVAHLIATAVRVTVRKTADRDQLAHDQLHVMVPHQAKNQETHDANQIVVVVTIVAAV